jgi:hypothetical protein
MKLKRGHFLTLTHFSPAADSSRHDGLQTSCLGGSGLLFGHGRPGPGFAVGYAEASGASLPACKFD